MAQFFEGQTATNPKTGQKIEYRKGRWVPIGQPSAGGAPAVNPDTFRRARDSVSAIDDATKRTNWFRTGLVGGLTANLPGSPAYNLDRDLDTLKARTAFDELAAMRRASPTGGALGAISDRELSLLQASEANLDVGQGERQIDRNLGRMRQTVVSRTPGVTPDNPIDLSGGQSRTSIPRGAYYRDPQGNIRRNDNSDRGNPIFRRAASGEPQGGGVQQMTDDDLKRALGL